MDKNPHYNQTTSTCNKQYFGRNRNSILSRVNHSKLSTTWWLTTHPTLTAYQLLPNNKLAMTTIANAGLSMCMLSIITSQLISSKELPQCQPKLGKHLSPATQWLTTPFSGPTKRLIDYRKTEQNWLTLAFWTTSTMKFKMWSHKLASQKCYGEQFDLQTVTTLFMTFTDLTSLLSALGKLLKADVTTFDNLRGMVVQNS